VRPCFLLLFIAVIDDVASLKAGKDGSLQQSRVM
jgi:hypothetical protein